MINMTFKPFSVDIPNFPSRFNPSESMAKYLFRSAQRTDTQGQSPDSSKYLQIDELDRVPPSLSSLSRNPFRGLPLTEPKVEVIYLTPAEQIALEVPGQTVVEYRDAALGKLLEKHNLGPGARAEVFADIKSSGVLNSSKPIPQIVADAVRSYVAINGDNALSSSNIPNPNPWDFSLDRTPGRLSRALNPFWQRAYPGFHPDLVFTDAEFGSPASRTEPVAKSVPPRPAHVEVIYLTPAEQIALEVPGQTVVEYRDAAAAALVRKHGITPNAEKEVLVSIRSSGVLSSGKPIPNLVAEAVELYLVVNQPPNPIPYGMPILEIPEERFSVSEPVSKPGHSKADEYSEALRTKPLSFWASEIGKRYLKEILAHFLPDGKLNLGT